MPGLKLRKGDRVQVLQGKDRGATGDIMRVMPKKNKIIVDGVNAAKKHQKPTKSTMQGGIIDRDMPIPVSSVAIICPAENKPTRIGYRFDDRGTKVRVCRKCGADL